MSGAIHASVIADAMSSILVLDGWQAYLIVGLLCFGEAAVMLGFVIPGETAVVLGGVMASQNHASLSTMLVVVIVSAIIGDSVGYEVGKHYGPRILELRVMRKRQGIVDFGRHFHRKRGMVGVFAGRFTALLRALVPGLAGIAGMPYRKFLLANALGGIVWGATFTLLGYYLGESIEKVTGPASTAVLIGIVLVWGSLVWRARLIERRLLGQNHHKRD